MAGKPAARVADGHFCGLPKHTPKGIQPPTATKTLIGGKPAARVGDSAMCLVNGAPVPDPISSGAMPVRTEGMPAAVLDSKTAHGGKVVVGCYSVLIGLAGTAGNVLAGIEACQAAAQGRVPPKGLIDPSTGQKVAAKTITQSYNNCGLEASRQLINTAGRKKLSQEELLDYAVRTGTALGSNKGSAIFDAGGTVPADREFLLNHFGVPAATAPQTLENITTAVGQGRGVIAAVWSSDLPTWKAWNAANNIPAQLPHTGGHAILVTGVKYDADGNPVAIVVNDTGLGQCGTEIPTADFVAALKPTSLVTTEKPVW